jgi:hypothetical protein
VSGIMRITSYRAGLPKRFASGSACVVVSAPE